MAEAGQDSIFNDFLFSLEKNDFGALASRGSNFHSFSIRFLLEDAHFGALAGQGLILIDFLLNSC